jgi:HAD superfamily hydrolase (TIGR01549 family)
MCCIDLKRRLATKNPLETISLDFGGTLVYEEKEDHIVYHEILAELGFNIDLNQLKEACESSRSWIGRKKAETGRVWDESMWIEHVSHMLSSLTLPNARKIALQVCELWPHIVTLKAYEDVKPTLAGLKQKGFRLIVISNVSSTRNLRSYLTQVDLEGYFDVLVGSGSVGYEKPNPEIFKLASKLSNTPFEKMMHVGDSYKEDYLGAESVGIKVVLLDRKGIHKDKECRKISQLTELFDFLDEP